MNMNSGVKRALLRNGLYVDSFILIEQSMVYSPGHMNAGLPKCIRQVLLERNLWSQGMKLIDTREVISRQNDFIEQKSLVEELATTAGQVALFLPK
jgi:hypothetical protein